MHVTHQPTPWYVTHDVFNGSKSQHSIRLVMHGQEYASQDLQYQHQQG